MKNMGKRKSSYTGTRTSRSRSKSSRSKTTEKRLCSIIVSTQIKKRLFKQPQLR